MRETHINEYPEKAITHAGVFHADDVFAFAFLRIINPFIRLERVNKVTPDMYKPNTVVFDIGGGPFDHHTKSTMEWRDPDYKKHPYASFGKVVRGYGDWLFDVPLLQDIFDRSLAVGIDKHDCGFPGYTNEISLVINAYNPTWLEQASSKKDPRTLFYERFMDAANLASQVIKRYIAKAKAMFASEMECDEAVAARENEDDLFVVLKRYVNYGNYLGRTPICWVIYPSMRGGWQLYSVSDHGYNRDIIPSDQVESIQEREGTIFVHPAGFTATFDTVDQAVAVARDRNMVILEQDPLFYAHMEECHCNTPLYRKRMEEGAAPAENGIVEESSDENDD